MTIKIKPRYIKKELFYLFIQIEIKKFTIILNIVFPLQINLQIVTS